MTAVAPADTGEDFGLFGPNSVTWRVHLQPVLWVASVRALYLQALHPQVIRGTAQNSALFDRDWAWQRFQRTADFVAIRTFGTTEEVARAGRRVRRMHARLRGHDPDTGAQFRIDDPKLLLGVPLPLPQTLRPLKLAVPPFVALSFAVLPEWARRLYGAPGLPTTDLAATLALRALRRATTLLPDPPPVQRARHLVRPAQMSSAGE